MSIRLSDLKENISSKSHRKKRKSNVNLAEQYDTNFKDTIPMDLENERKKNAVLKRKKKSLEKYDRLINKTEKLIAKSNKSKVKNNKLPAVTVSSQCRHTLRSDPSLTDYYLLKRLPRNVMNFIFQKHRELNIKNDGLFIIDTFELVSVLNKSASQIGNCIMRLKNQGFIHVEKSSNTGARLIRLNQSLFE